MKSEHPTNGIILPENFRYILRKCINISKDGRRNFFCYTNPMDPSTRELIAKGEPFIQPSNSVFETKMSVKKRAIKLTLNFWKNQRLVSMALHVPTYTECEEIRKRPLKSMYDIKNGDELGSLCLIKYYNDDKFKERIYAYDLAYMDNQFVIIERKCVRYEGPSYDLEDCKFIVKDFTKVNIEFFAESDLSLSNFTLAQF